MRFYSKQEHPVIIKNANGFEMKMIFVICFLDDDYSFSLVDRAIIMLVYIYNFSSATAALTFAIPVGTPPCTTVVELVLIALPPFWWPGVLMSISGISLESPLWTWLNCGNTMT